MTKRAKALTAFIGVLFVHGVAQAQGTPSKADQLFKDARKLMDAKDYAGACSKFAESQKLDPAAGTLMNLADCYEKNGQTASAYATFQDAVKAAGARNRQDWVTTSQQHIAALEPKLSHWSVSVSPDTQDVAGLRVERDGAALEHDAWGTDSAVDPGAHIVAASAPGRKAWTLRVDVPPGKSIATEVPALDPDGTAQVHEDTQQKKTDPWVDSGAKPSDGSTMRIVGWALAGVGVVGVGVGVFTGIKALSSRSDAMSKCSNYPTVCSSAASGPNSDAKTFATVSTISFIAGVALAGGGIALVLVAPKGHAETPEKTDKTSLRVIPGFGGLALDGTF